MVIFPGNREGSMIVSAMLALALQDWTPPAPETLNFNEAYGCSVLSQVTRDNYFSGGTTPQTTGEQAIWDRLTKLHELAEVQVARAQADEQLTDEVRVGVENGVRSQFGDQTDEILVQILDRCAMVFGV
jgi:hypothetical protein